MLNQSRRRSETVVRILCTDTALDCVSPLAYVLLAEGKGLTRGYADLLFHQVHTADFLCDRMFHLEAGVHFEEIEILPAVHEEFYGPGSHIAHVPCRCHCRLSHSLAGGIVYERTRTLLHDFLMPALHGTLPVEKVYHIAVFIAKYLYLNMMRRLNEFLDIHGTISERRNGLGTGSLVHKGHFIRRPRHSHTLASTSH